MNSDSAAMNARLQKLTEMAESALIEELPSADICKVSEAISYSSLAGGKRLRPVILLASCEAAGGDIECALPFSAALEMIHTYSLIHDDLPAMDDDDYRRGHLSCHKKFDEATAILAGDALLNRAFEVMLKAASDTLGCYNKETSAFKLVSRQIRAAKIIADASGINGMVYGQALDIANESIEANEKTLRLINENKTGALISSAFQAGAVLGGASNDCSKLFCGAGLLIGRAFQIQDDVLDYCGEQEMLGKPIGSDKKNNKKTYAALWGIEKCRLEIQELTKEAVNLLKRSGADTRFIIWLAEKLINRTK